MILVTGGAGFLGAHLVRFLLGDSRFQHHHIVVLDDLSGGYLENVPQSSRVTFVKGSVTDHQFLNELFATHKFEFIYHLAAYAAEGLSHFIRRFNYTNNLIGSTNLINAAILHESKHLVFTSSIAVYGAAQVPMLESTTPQPEDPYGIAKYAVEMDLKAAHEQFGLNYTIFRPHNVYGEYQNVADRYRNVVGIFMNRLLQGQTLPVFGDGLQKRAFSYAGDLMNPIASAPLIPAASGGIFNVGASVPMTVLELAHAVCQEFGVEPQIEFLPPRNEVKFAWADHRRCDEVFGHQPATSLAEGLRRMANWVRQTGPRRTPSFGQIEVAKNLPSFWLD